MEHGKRIMNIRPEENVSMDLFCEEVGSNQLISVETSSVDLQTPDRDYDPCDCKIIREDFNPTKPWISSF